MSMALQNQVDELEKKVAILSGTRLASDQAAQLDARLTKIEGLVEQYLTRKKPGPKPRINCEPHMAPQDD